MTLTTHSAIGSLIGSFVGTPLLGFSLGIFSHYLVDMIPHGDANLGAEFRKGMRKRIMVLYPTLDALSAIFFLLAIFSLIQGNTPIAFTAAIAGSIIPDLLVAIYELRKLSFLKSHYKFHIFLHDFFVKKYGDIKLKYALIFQGIFIVSVLIFFLQKSP